MPTARDMIARALRESGVNGLGQTPSAEDITDGLTRLNAMLAQWSIRRWLVYHLVTYAIQATGSNAYTIGPGGDLCIDRPNRIESAFARMQPDSPSPVDYPLRLITSREDYNQITMKSLGSMPGAAFYDSGYPLGMLYVWPLPGNNFDIHVTVKEPLQQFRLDDEICMPPEYDETIHYNLVARTLSAYRMPQDAAVVQLAAAGMAAIRGSNAQISELQMPAGLAGRRGYPANYGGGFREGWSTTDQSILG